MALINSLVAYYKMDEASGNLVDSTSNNTIVTFTGGYGAAGIINHGVSFAGVAQYATLPNAANFTNTSGGSLSINMWIYMTTAHLTAIANLFGSNIAPGFYFPVDQGTNQYDLRYYVTGVAFNDGTVTTYVASTWYMLTMVKSGGTVSFYRNGTLLGSSSVGGDATVTNTQYIGGDPSSEAFPGIIDEVGYWSRAITTDEITALYNGGLGLSYPFSAYTYDGVMYINEGGLWVPRPLKDNDPSSFIARPTYAYYNSKWNLIQSF
jgi:hypothetical protein